MYYSISEGCSNSKNVSVLSHFFLNFWCPILNEIRRIPELRVSHVEMDVSINCII